MRVCVVCVWGGYGAVGAWQDRFCRSPSKVMATLASKQSSGSGAKGWFGYFFMSAKEPARATYTMHVHGIKPKICECVLDLVRSPFVAVVLGVGTVGRISSI